MPPAHEVIGVIPATPGQTVIRIWVDTDDYVPVIERWPVIAWRVYDEWAEPICTSAKTIVTEEEFFVQPDGKLAEVGGDHVCDTLDDATLLAVMRAQRRSS